MWSSRRSKPPPYSTPFRTASAAWPGYRLENFLIKQVVEEIAREKQAVDDVRYAVASAEFRTVAQSGALGSRIQRVERGRP